MLTWTVLLMLALQPSHSLYNKHFRKCRLYPHSAEPDAIPEEELLEERVPVYVTSFYTPPQEEPQKAL